jgi:nitrite reductase/ring-hydroxylating ferredoxin subunit
MPEPAVTAAQLLPLCPAADLAEGGRALVWDVLLWGQPARAFVLRHGGALRGYINRCAHVPVEMDWRPGDFLDADQRFIVCAIHGASYDPADGRCVGGPCGRGRLIAVDVVEAGGQACWYPSRDIRPLPAAAAGAALPSTPMSPR